MVYRGGMVRSYQLNRRAKRQDQTRQRIVEAAVRLHQSKGIAATTVLDIAKLAKVGRVTVYRHFPDEAALVGACSSHYFERHPLPDPEPWRSIQDPYERFRHGLRETYAYHSATESMISRVLPEVRDDPVVAPYYAHWQRAGDVLAAAWPATGHHRKLLFAALMLALDFDTWRNLVHVQGLTEDEAIELMLRLMCDCAPNPE
jgi:AcrR family transcriptional regulator